MPTLNQIRDKAEPILADFWLKLKEKQDAYFAKNGKYFQLLISPESDVVDGVDSDFTVRNPLDEKRVIDVNFSYSSKIPFQIEVDEWVGYTNGYQVTVTVKYQDNLYRRTRKNSGEDTGWFIFNPDPKN